MENAQDDTAIASRSQWLLHKFLLLLKQQSVDLGESESLELWYQIATNSQACSTFGHLIDPITTN